MALAERRPNEFSPSALERVGVEIICEIQPLLRCFQCGDEWPVQNDSQEPDAWRNPPGWWRCPSGCQIPSAG